MKFALVMIAVLVIIGGGTYWFLRSSQDEMTEEVVTEDVIQEVLPVEVETADPESIAEVESQPIEVADDPVPVLDESTDWVMKKTKPLLEHPIFEGFFKQKEIIRKLVAVVDRMSRGENPYRHISYLKPSGSFEVEGEGESLVMSPENNRRTTALIEAIDAMPAHQLLSFYKKSEPLFEEAYNELGNLDHWGDAVDRVFNEIEQFSYPEGPIELVGRKGVYIFKDSSLEELSPLQKALIRMGPEHANKVKLLARTYHRR